MHTQLRLFNIYAQLVIQVKVVKQKDLNLYKNINKMILRKLCVALTINII